MSEPQDQQLPGKGLFGWLGWQVGYVGRAIRHPAHPPEESPAKPQEPPQKVYRQRQVIEQPMPGNPDVVLRRTVIDEAIVKKDEADED